MRGHDVLCHRVLERILERLRAFEFLLVEFGLELLLVGLDFDELILQLAQILIQLLLVHLESDDVLLLDPHLLVELVDLVPQVVLLFTDGALVLCALIIKQFG